MAEWSKVLGFPLGDLRLEPRFDSFSSFRLALFSRFQFYHLQRPSSIATKLSKEPLRDCKCRMTLWWCEIECLVGAIVRSYRISDIFCVSVPKTNNENTLFCASILWQTEPKAHGSLRTQSPARPGIPPTQNLAGCQSHN